MMKRTTSSSLLLFRRRLSVSTNNTTIPCQFHTQLFSTDSSRQSHGEDEYDDSSASMNPWKNLLENAARASWRSTDPHPPEALLDAMDQILEDGDRTPKQLKRAYGRVLAKQNELASFRERDRRRVVNGKLAARDESIDPVFYAHEQMLANLKFRLLPNYAVTKRVMEETKSLLGPSFVPKRVIDFGIGCGSASAAALDVFETIEWIHGIEPSHSMRECSEKLLEALGQHRETAPRVTYSDSLSPDTASSFDMGICAYTATEIAQWESSLAAAALLFEKLHPNGVLVFIEPGTPDGFNSLRAIRNMLLDCCPPEDPDFEWEDTCHVIAPCTHNGSCPMVRHKKNFSKAGKKGCDIPQEKYMQDVDDDNNNMMDGDFDFTDADDEEIEWDDVSDSEDEDDNQLSAGKLYKETTAFDSSFCSFVQTMPGSQRGKGEKLSYLVVQKRRKGEVIGTDLAPFANAQLATMLMDIDEADTKQDDKALGKLFEEARQVESLYMDSDADDLGLELLRGDKNRQSMGRIIRAPIKKRGHVYIDYCGSPGRIIRGRVTKATSQVAPGIYTAARKSRWGGFWPDTTKK
jgi:ribosomal protein RSM22 (predicted rRNA methylase)